ncbi:MAG: 50S ribosomal protein L28 [Nitrospirae bacterium CG18_big_fil_WC_8_21_14_2_50_70_55]|nr:50S ribosomal protein L28 [Deltaproteobacteria bacterium]OIP64786.1 MAG: 50S ribosomal protein L28 [Nitrospirae bacterium CG2_30_70_394]PIQ06884.1 MAG: 50S ribosomal protein L28 [Nitrospirae bacterium CG18_big_fil_WC_8_21_14_2_50_70_55]PIU80278.1 MAG: 50S ribosomal protein L28 [Nitrospirae bacterium CG06_land_8_20_14_3_00_70_43]PIW82649.1 MAG: 50S ribosomal protein L28 [Nitrospirae bacterium CG_4_8_14_3_um_filter_70_85]HBB40648.1 50S ribosomal protein L28 [Pseudomonadota bacterium]
MARTCEICGKGYQVGMKVSHAHNRSKKWWHPNLQRVHVLVGATRKHVRICTQCLKRNWVQKAG